MGQEQSQEVVKEVSREELSHDVALKFAEKCYSQLELYCFKQVFNSLADTESDVRYWSEASLCKYLELPDALGAGPVIYQMATHLGAFPFPSQAPCIVTKEALIKVVTLMTQRYTRVLKRGNTDRLRLIYGSLSVYDRRVSEALNSKPEAVDQLKGDHPENAIDEAEEISKGVAGFAIDQPKDDVEDDDVEDDDDDALALAALDSLDAIEAVKLGEKADTIHSFIPTDNLLKLIELLLLVAPLGAQESLSKYSTHLDEKGLEELRQVAACIVSTFDIEDVPGINFRTFRNVVPTLLPHMFDGLNALFEHFLFNKDFDLSKKRRQSSSSPLGSPTREQADPPLSHRRRRSSGGGTEPFPGYPSGHNRRVSVTSVHTRSFSTADRIPEDAVLKSPISPTFGGHDGDHFPDLAEEPQPLLPEGNHLLSYSLLSQLAFFLSPTTLFHRMYHLYSGDQHGFSINSLNTTVATWTGPSLLLLSGTLLSTSTEPHDSRERTFHNHLPPRRFPPSSAAGTRVRYGAYLPMQLKPTHRAPLSDPATLLFQLSPTHDLFPASTLSTAHLTFTPASTDAIPGLGIGCALPPSTGARAGRPATAELGAVSLWLDDALEFGAFTHTADGGGSFRPSTAPGRRRADWQDRFEVDAVEVWGLGGETQVRDQRRAVEFEEREARLRREGRGSVSAGGVEADRELLRMAGIIGRHSESGGSMS